MSISVSLCRCVASFWLILLKSEARAVQLLAKFKPRHPHRPDSAYKCDISAAVNWSNLTLDMVHKRMNVSAEAGDDRSNCPITVTAQQSRYAKDAVDAPATKEVSPVVIRSCNTHTHHLPDPGERLVHLSCQSRVVEPHNPTSCAIAALCPCRTQWYWQVNLAHSSKRWPHSRYPVDYQDNASGSDTRNGN
jgi:hypothetical protein